MTGLLPSPPQSESLRDSEFTNAAGSSEELEPKPESKDSRIKEKHVSLDIFGSRKLD